MSDLPADKIGRQGLVNKIKYFIDMSNNSSCIALNGGWGSGKSYVINMLQNEFEKSAEYVVINYDAWKNNFYSDPLIAILYCLLDGIKDYVGELKDSKGKFAKGLLVSGKKFGNEIISEMKKSGGKLALFAGIIETIKNIVIASEKLVKHQKFEDFNSYQTLLKDTQKTLSQITEFISEDGKKMRLIVLVDEIDRCLPNEQLIVLERLHHLFEVKNCIVIVAINQKSTATTIHTLYGINGYEYLCKFFDLTFELCPSVGKYFENLLNEFCGKFNNVNDDFAEVIEYAYGCIRYGSKNVLDRVDNRDISRYYESLINLCEQYGYDKLNPYYVFFIILALFIRKFISHSFLSKHEINENYQNKIEESKTLSTPSMRDLVFDYLLEYLGFDAWHLPEEIREKYNHGNQNIKIYAEYFSEMVMYSTGCFSVNNAMRMYEHRVRINIEECKMLASLVNIYSGEQKRNG